MQPDRRVDRQKDRTTDRQTTDLPFQSGCIVEPPPPPLWKYDGGSVLYPQSNLGNTKNMVNWVIQRIW